MAKPTKLPRWANTDVVDPISTKNNVIEPSESKKDLGFGPAGEFIVRQSLNWLFRTIYEWLTWLDETTKTGVVELELEAVGTSFSAITTPAGGILNGGKIDFDMNYTVQNGVIVLSHVETAGNFTEISGVLASSNSQLRVNLRSGSTWPNDLNTPSFNQENVYPLVDNTGKQIGLINIVRDKSSIATTSIWYTNTTGTVGQTVGLGISPITYAVK